MSTDFVGVGSPTTQPSSEPKEFVDDADGLGSPMVDSKWMPSRPSSTTMPVDTPSADLQPLRSLRSDSLEYHVRKFFAEQRSKQMIIRQIKNAVRSMEHGVSAEITFDLINYRLKFPWPEPTVSFTVQLETGRSGANGSIGKVTMLDAFGVSSGVEVGLISGFKSTSESDFQFTLILGKDQIIDIFPDRCEEIRILVQSEEEDEIEG